MDTTDESLMAVDVLLELRREMKDFIDLQLVTFPQDGVLRSRNGMAILKRALDMGVDLVGVSPILKGPWIREKSPFVCSANWQNSGG